LYVKTLIYLRNFYVGKTGCYIEHLRHFIRLDFLTTYSYNSCTINSKEDCISYHSY